MGIILSRVQKKKSTIEVLEALEKDIKEIEENKSDAQRNYKKITKLFLVYSMGLYIFCGIVFYYCFSTTFREKLLYLVPLALSPLLLYIVKRIISWYYIRLINQNQIRLNEMKKEKKKILDEVMEKETYKVAKEILDKFSSDTLPKPKQMQIAPISSLTSNALRKRINAPKAELPSNILKSLPTNQPPRPINQIPTNPLQAQNTPKYWMPAPILSLNRSYMDKIVEYLIGDGPNNRYALICSRCHSHNGMALKEEFEYIGYKCCYCYHYNPARKIKPEAPKLETSFKSIKDADSDSDSETSTFSDTGFKAISNNELTSTKDQMEALDTLGDTTPMNSTNLENNPYRETVKNSQSDEKLIDSTADENMHEETMQQENSVEEPSSSNQADDSNCDLSFVRN